MKSVKELTVNDILTCVNPEKIFSVKTFKQDSQALLQKWHPDKSKDSRATEVFIHLSSLIKDAKEKIHSNAWNGPNELIFTNIDPATENKTYSFSYLKYHNIQIGKMYIAKKYLMYVIDADYEDLYNNYLYMISKVSYNDKKMEDQFKPQLPKLIINLKSDIGFVIIVEKTEDLVLLKDLIDYMPDNKLDPKHVAWIMSTLCNLACFLELNNIAHNAITSSTFWVTPKYHSGVLLGGWWYARSNNTKLLALPADVIPLLSSNIKEDKKAKTVYDRMLIKSIGIECLGDSTKLGSMLLKDPNIPKPFISWLKNPSNGSAVDEYKKWCSSRDLSFGERKFIHLDVDINQIY
ncbi:MAG: hypothetical protein ACXW2E_01175 [Nitrososphaeraceae archaeon]